MPSNRIGFLGPILPGLGFRYSSDFTRDYPELVIMSKRM